LLPPFTFIAANIAGTIMDNRPFRRHKPRPSPRSRARLRAEEQVAHEARLAFEAQLRDPEAAPATTRPRRRVTRAARRPLWVKIRRFGLLLIPLALVELGVAALTSRHFAVRGVDIIGLQVTSPVEIQPIAARLVGQNWLRADMKSAAQAAQKLPAVREAKVVRVLDNWPPRLALRVEERVPFLRVGGDQTWWIVDQAGVPFRRATKADDALLAVTSTAIETEAIRAGQLLPEASWEPARQLAQALREDEARGTKWPLRRIYLDRNGFASLRITGGDQDELLVRLGDNEWPEKLQRARQSMDYFAATGKRAVALNLVSYNMPTWTPRPPEKPSSEDAANDDSGDEFSLPDTLDTPNNAT
jgi:cell division septal protein FtsQ